VLECPLRRRLGEGAVPEPVVQVGEKVLEPGKRCFVIETRQHLRASLRLEQRRPHLAALRDAQIDALNAPECPQTDVADTGGRPDRLGEHGLRTPKVAALPQCLTELDQEFAPSGIIGRQQLGSAPK